MHCLFAERTYDVLNEREREEAKEGSDRAFSGMRRIDFVVHNVFLLFNVRLFEVDYIYRGR